jgi:A/G-specific adenine glycosylase
MGIPNTLLAWYDEHRRDLPWRQTTDPYPVWLSEVILQQTRVAQGMAYYYKFLELFPSVQALAAASEDQVLKAWQGLGYYSRAGNLHATAKHVVQYLDGVFPTTAAELKKLKGVGDYTAAAIASFCYREVVPVMDGNVMRVVSRLMAVDQPMDKPLGRGLVMDVLHDWIPISSPDKFNQAMMEFGALQCTPKNPSCDTCVFFDRCEARKQNRVLELPMKSTKTKVKDIWMYYMVAEVEGQTLIRRRDGDGIWKGLYDFPSLDTDEAMDPLLAAETWMQSIDSSKVLEVQEVSTGYTHLLSHRRVHAYFIRLKCGQAFSPPAQSSWVSSASLHSLGVSRLVDRYLQHRETSRAEME